MATTAHTLAYLIQHLRNWPFFLVDVALTGLVHTRRLFTYRWRDGTQLVVRPFTTDKWVLTDIWTYDPYWHPGFRLSAAPVLVDIGAHIGGWTVYMSRRFPQARVVAFEPVGENFALLQENIRLNQLTRVTAFNVALAPQAGMLKLWFDSKYSAYSGVNPRPMHQHGAFLSVPALTLSACLKKAGLASIDILKCDIEGAEFALLPSLPPDLLKTVANISLEYHLFDKNDRIETLIDFFERHGFELLTCIPRLLDSGYALFRRRTASA